MFCGLSEHRHDIRHRPVGFRGIERIHLLTSLLLRKAHVLQRRLYEELTHRLLQAGDHSPYVVLTVAVFPVVTREEEASFLFKDVDMKRRLGLFRLNRAFLRFLPADSIPENLTALPGEHDIGGDLLLVGNFREGIEVVVHAFLQLPAEVTHKGGDRLLSVKMAEDRESLNQHHHGSLEAGVPSAVVYRGIKDIVPQIVFAHEECKCRIEEGVYAQVVLFAELTDRFYADLRRDAEAADTGFLTVYVPFGQHVGLRIRKQFCKVSPGTLIPVCFAQLFFIEGRLKSGISLRGNPATAVSRTDILHQDHAARAVIQDVMEIHKEIAALIRLQDLQPV